MKPHPRRILWIALSLSLVTAGLYAENDPKLRGVWKTVSYVIDDTPHKLDGLFLFTERHFSANVLFELTGGEFADSNANAGTYRTEGDRLVFEQQVQIHIRPGDPSEPLFYGNNAVEESTYRVVNMDGGGVRLEVIFPSGNHYICERVE